MEAIVGEEGKASGIEKFNGTNFGYWRMQIENYLYGKMIGQKFIDPFGKTPLGEFKVTTPENPLLSK